MEARKRKEQDRTYNRSPRGVARNLRCEHGIDKPTSEYWAQQMFNPGSRCAICGFPTYLFEVYKTKGWPWFLGRSYGAGSHPRLTLDHIRPGDNNGGFRLLCSACNGLRGAGRLSDEEVLHEVRSKWRWLSALRFLWWLNTSPGVGGRLHRSLACQKRDAQFVDGASPVVDSTPPMTSTNSPSALPCADSAE